MKKITLLFALVFSFFAYGQSDTVTFKVDMNNYTGTFTTVHVNGTFNSWCGSCNPLSDANSDGIWEVSLPLTADSIEYKFTLDGWTAQEILTPGSTCTKTTGPNTNRFLVINGNVTLPVVCWESCGACATLAQIDLPITWNDTANVDYTVTDFGGAISTLVVDPTNATNMVLKTDKPSSAQSWAGTTLSTPAGLSSAIPFTTGSTVMTVDVWAPDTGIVVRLKVEDATDPTKTCETDAVTTVAGGWQTLTFDFSNQAAGTAALNFSNVYNKASIFYNFLVVPTSTQTFYCDNVMMGTGGGPTLAQIDLPISWNDTSNVDYTVTDFGGAISTLVVDPTNASNMVLKTDKPSTAQSWAGTTLGTPAGFASAIPFAAGSTVMTVDVWAPDTGIVVRLKVEDSADPTITCETDAVTTVAGGWQTLTFDFSNQAAGTAALNFSNVYNKASIFYNFLVVPTSTQTFYCDNVMMGTGGGPTLAQIDLPITWNDTANVDYTVTDFGGAISTLVVDPTNATNMVLKTDKPSTAQSWAGTTLGTPAGFASAIPFAAGSTVMTVEVWSPDSGITVRLKVEDSADPTITCETDAVTTVAGGWQTLTFDFSNQAAGTAALNFSNVYNKASIFYNFLVVPTSTQTFYCDNIMFGASNPPGTHNITFRLDMNNHSGTFTTPEISGDFTSWCGGCAPMSDADMDNIWEITIPISSDSIEYKFNVDNWTAQEALQPGSPCTKTTGGFTNRFMHVTQDTTLPAVCWNSCSECTGAPTSASVTFQVDLSDYTGTYSQVNLNGTFNGWCGSCAPMTSPNNDSIYEVTVVVPTDTIEFKFTLDGWNAEESLTQGSFCTLTTIDAGITYVNRFLVPTADTVLPVVCWESCGDCNSIGLEESNWGENLTISPNPSTGLVTLRAEFSKESNLEIRVTDIQGRIIFQENATTAQLDKTIDLQGFDNGIYMIHMTSELGSVTEKVLIAH